MIDYPNKLNIIFDKLKKNNIKSIIVGGYIRDFLLKISNKDIDIELYGVSSFKRLEEILEEFGDVNSVGKSFGVCKLSLKDLEIDFTLPRHDNKIDSGHRGFDIKIDNSLDFKSAALRRDFTMNAIGYDVETKELLDPYMGIKDLKDGVLNAVNNNTFVEDPLRILRAVQFCARFNLKVSDKLSILCQSMVQNGSLKELSSERILLEIEKLLLKAPQPSIGLKLLKELGAINLFPGLKKLSDRDFDSTLLAVDSLSKLKTNNNKTNTTLMLAILSHKFSINDIKTFITSLSSEKSLLNGVISINQNYKKINSLDTNLLTNFSIYKLATEASIYELLIINRALYISKNSSNNYDRGDIVEKRAKELGVLHKKAIPLLQGKDILLFGLEPSSKYSEILKDAYEAQIHSKFHSHKEAQEWLKNYLTS